MIVIKLLQDRKKFIRKIQFYTKSKVYIGTYFHSLTSEYFETVGLVEL